MVFHYRQSHRLHKSLCGSTGHNFVVSKKLTTCAKCLKSLENYKPIPETISTTDIEVADCHSDAGDAHSFYCPRCQEKMVIASAGWWDESCRCGYKWSIELRAVGDLN